MKRVLTQAEADQLQCSKAVAESDRACVVARLEEFRASCDGYMTKAVWRELDAIMVEFGAEHKPYKFT